ncbi:MAG: hypothetical protein MZW92_17470 [Comamonadaceae bacterium]|nr:hypothetical protein [Comamonadaceae bacterium]
MPDPGDGSTTYYYTNEQSARLMFYHDHAFGITRLNVYAGEAAGYVITDKYEQDLVARGLLPADQIPLIIQDKTFVDATPTTKYHLQSDVDRLCSIRPSRFPRSAKPTRSGTGEVLPPVGGVVPPVTGDLWLPARLHAGPEPARRVRRRQPLRPLDVRPLVLPGHRASPMGRSPTRITIRTAAARSRRSLLSCTTPGQPPQIPGTPNVSMGMEAFQDSAVVNGTAFPTLTVDPQAYRFRILNAASDRFQNLSFYVADPTAGDTSPDPRPAVAGTSN